MCRRSLVKAGATKWILLMVLQRVDCCSILYPTGRSIQKSYSDGNEEYFKESESRFEKASYEKKDSIKSRG
jgi:hypothetical protein